MIDLLWYILLIFAVSSIVVFLTGESDNHPLQEINMWKKVKDWFMSGYERVRARNSKGQYIKDDPKTKKNEAYTLRKKKPIKK